MGSRHYRRVFGESVVQASGREVVALAFAPLAALPVVLKAIADAEAEEADDKSDDETKSAQSPAEERPEPESSSAAAEPSDASADGDGSSTGADRADDESASDAEDPSDVVVDDVEEQAGSDDMPTPLWDESIPWDELRWRIAHYEDVWSADSQDAEFADAGVEPAFYDLTDSAEGGGLDTPDPGPPDDPFIDMEPGGM